MRKETAVRVVIDPELKYTFQKWCLENRITMTQAVTESIKVLVQQKSTNQK